MMDLNMFNLIQKSENAEMYMYQQKLINKIDDRNGENAIKLALLLTLAPIGDYTEALKILLFFSELFSNVKLEIIKYYFLLQWGTGIDLEQIKVLLSMKNYDSETESLFYYLMALQLERFGNKKKRQKKLHCQ